MREGKYTQRVRSQPLLPHLHSGLTPEEGTRQSTAGARAYVMNGIGAHGRCKLVVSPLSSETDEHRLRAYFENFGVVTEAFVSYDRQTNRPRG